MKFTAGQILIITSGEYEQFYPMGVYRVLRDFEAPEGASGGYWKAGEPPRKHVSAWSNYEAAKADGTIEEIVSTEWWLG
jgi:hypothetical protein